MIGYKAFDKDLKCRDFQFEVGKTYKTKAKKDELELCTDTVFHFCRELHRIEAVSNYTIANSRVCEVIAEGDIVTDGDKYGTNKLTILREIPKEELQEYNNRNSGNRNSGDWNSGNCNSGNRNSGDCNSGNWNSGNRNSGNRNSGDWNSGNCNSGNRNSGNHNSGYCNSGYCNSGDWNSGDWNSGNCNSGFFNSDEPYVRMFNKMTKKKRSEINIPSWCYFELAVWVSHDTASDKEKEEHKKEIETCGGFLKTLEYKEAWRLAWDKADKEQHKELLKLPNWDNEVFKEITGIDAEQFLREVEK
jgi:hypothetical protein